VQTVAQLVGVRRLRRLLLDLGVDAVHYHLYASALAGRLATLRTRIVRVHTVAGPLYLENRLIRHVERLMCQLDDVLIASTGDIRDRYLALGTSARRSRELPYGIDLDRFSPAPAELRRSARADLGLSESEFVAVCVAYFYPPKLLVHRGQGIKGHETLLRAWAAYRLTGGTGTLLLVGGGHGARGDAYRASVQAWARGLPGADSV
nr:glycosyltransferase [Micromonospora sp. DSM 115978]